MKYRLNFLGSVSDKEKKVETQLISTIVYGILCFFTIFLLIQFFITQSSITNIHLNSLIKIQETISDLEPSLLFIEKQVAERNRLLKQSNFYVQEMNRPSVWVARLIDLFNSLPPDLIITRIFFNPSDSKNMKNPEITIDGFMIVKGNEQDVFDIDDLRQTLLDKLSTGFSYSELLVENNNLYKDGDDLKLEFSLGYYR